MNRQRIFNPTRAQVDSGLWQHRVVLHTVRDGGGMIEIWENAPDSFASARRLPHIWSISEDGQWVSVTEAHFMHSENALAAWRELHSISDALNLASRVLLD